MKRHLSLAFLLAACAGSDDTAHVAEPSAGEPSVDTPSPEPREEPTVDEPEGDGARARAIRIAEVFVRAQGYTDVPPTVPDEEIVHEGIEGSIDMRLNMLEEHAMTASGEGDDWMVIFRYRDPRSAGRGRAVQLRGDAAPRMVHQDVVLDAFE